MNNSRILLVDDDENFLRTVAAILTDRGYEVTALNSSATDALPNDEPFDLVITDLIMKPRDGVELLQQVKAVDPDCPVIIITGYADMASSLRALRNGADDYLLKPCPPEKLLSRIKRSLDNAESKKQSRRVYLGKKKTESLNRLAGAVAHRFNNHLGVVLGNLELARSDMSDPSAQDRYLADAMTAAQRAADVSRLMLVSLGLSPGATRAVDLAQVCRECLPSLTREIPGHTPEDASPDMSEHIRGSARVRTDITPSVLNVKVDADHIRIMLDNLLTNAREAIAPGDGEIRLAVKPDFSVDIGRSRVAPPDWQPEERPCACLEVTDTGCGIERRYMDQLFDPFFSDKFTGRGLGLPVVLGIARRCGGAVAVDSQSGQGSRFRVILPLTDAAVAPATAPETSLVRDFAERPAVLVAEDEAMFRYVVQTMLEQMGLLVFTAVNGLEALNLFRKNREIIGAVVCDLAMPVMDGWETLAALRAVEPDIPVIMASGLDNARQLTENRELSPQAFLDKPFEMSRLKDTLEKVWGRSLPDKVRSASPSPRPSVGTTRSSK